MTNDEIDTLIKVRNAITDRRDLDFVPDTGSIDALLATVPAGQRNDVDLLLGRMCAVLEQFAPRPCWSVNPSVMLEQDETQRLIETTRRVWNEAEPIEY